jgi:cytochrome c nitrite reductase small subunit
MRYIRERSRERQYRLALMLYGVAGVLVFAFVFPAILAASSSPGFCKICHSMNPEYQTWTKSSHAQIPCYGCHGPKSIATLIYNKSIVDSKGPLQEITGMFLKPVNEESELSQEEIPMERCERCHNNANRKFTFSKGIYMDHDKHKAAGINCTVCHNRVVHKGAEKYEPTKSWAEAGFAYTDYLTMKDGCLRCHSASPESRNEETLKKIKNGKKPPQACTACHTKDFKLPVGHEGAEWRTQHGPIAKQDIKYCMSCHSEKAKFANGSEPWCTLCHDKQKVESLIGGTWETEPVSGGENDSKGP